MALTRPRYSQIYDTDYKQSVRLATTADVGNLLAGGGNITNTVDGVTVAANDRILVKDQSDGKQNGIYRVVTVGTGSNGTWIRALDADASDKVTSGMSTTISEGNTNFGKTYKLNTPDPITLGTTSLTFINPFDITASAGGANTQVQFNDMTYLSGSPGFTFEKTSNILGIAGGIITGNCFITDSRNNPFTSNNALYVSGGATIGQDVAVGGRLVACSFATSTNINSGAIQTNGGIGAWGNLFIGGLANIAGDLNVQNITCYGNILPSANVTYDLGSPTQRWRDGWFSGTTIHIGSESMSVDTNGKWSFSSNGTTVDLGVGADFNPPTINTSGNVTVGGNLFVGGALYIAGNTTVISTNNLSLSDSLIYLAEGNPSDFLDVGFIGNFTRSELYSHTGFARDATDGVWKLFEGVEPEPTTTIDFGSASYATALVGNLVTRSNVTVGGNIRLGRALLSSAGLGGDPGQYLTSTGTGIAWTTLEISTNSISDGTTNVVAEGAIVNVAVSGSNVVTINDQGVSLGGNLTVDSTLTVSGYTGVGTSSPLGGVPWSSNWGVLGITGSGQEISSGGLLNLFNSRGAPSSIDSFGIVSFVSSNSVSGHRAKATITGFADGSGGVTGGYGGALRFGTKADNSAVDVSERMRINHAGNVGIGNTAPVHKLSVGGDLFVGNIVTSSNSVANIGSVTNRFNTVHARATQAQYADLAEIYVGDKHYVPGTVVVFGGDKEVTVSTVSHDPSVAGVVSTNPAYLMNDGVDGVAIALQGRVPCRVLGPVNKGDRVVSSDVRGVAERLDMTKYQPGCIIGKSLESIPDNEIATIEVVVGRN